ncbi:MAG: hypothetical protein JWN17_1028 [Frankiales bacterium]|nr:hypothetical protein [Frankiales bacterium]
MVASRLPRLAVCTVAALAVVLPTAVGSASAAGTPTAARISAAAKPVKDASGRTWAVGRGFVGGRRTAIAAPVARTHSDRLYQAQRAGVAGFSQPLQRGTYDVTLHLADGTSTRPGQRVFDVVAEGRVVASGVDIVRTVGRDAAYALTVRVPVADGRLDLAFRRRVGEPTVAAVSAVRRSASVARPAAPTKQAPKPVKAPTTTPTVLPTTAPTASTTTSPTAAPTTAATVAPTSPATAAPTVTPTDVAPVVGPPTTVSPTPSDTGAPTTAPAAPATTAPTASSALAPAPAWKSGASGDGLTDGTFAAWRGTPVGIVGTYADNDQGQIELWSLKPGQAYSSANWKGDVDLAVGAIGWDESWAQAATGAYDARWRQSLENLKGLWTGREGTLYLRFAHEMNGSWYAWNVTSANKDAFIASWKRYRALQQEILPQAKLVFSVNRDSPSNMIDWRQTFPGKQYVDVLAVDYYNIWPAVHTEAEWDAELWAKDQFGGPKGLLAHQAFAKSVGLPFAVSEWGNNVTEWGESPLFVKKMHDFFAANAGSGPGQVLYDLYFNPKGAEDGKWALWPETKQQATADAYRDAF